MFSQKIGVLNAKKSFSLVEFLVSLALSAFLLMVFGQQYAIEYKKYEKPQKLFDLQKSANFILDYLKPHIEHIGFVKSGNKNPNKSLFAPKKSYYLEDNCLMFIYDLNQDGCIGKKDKKGGCTNNTINNTNDINKETIGIKLYHQEIYIYDKGNKFKNCISSECAKLLSQCQYNGWHQLTYQENYRVEELKFEWIKEGELMKISLSLALPRNSEISYTTYSIINILNKDN